MAITPRNIELVSDNGRYTIKAKLISESDSYTQDNWLPAKTYRGSHWTASIMENGRPIKGIQVIDGNYQPYITIDTICCHGIKLSKNTILYLAYTTRMFKKALSDIDCKKVERKYNSEYLLARIADGTL